MLAASPQAAARRLPELGGISVACHLVYHKESGRRLLEKEMPPMANKHSRRKFSVCQQEEDCGLGVLKDVLKSAGCDPEVSRHSKSTNSASFDPAKHAGLIVLGGGQQSANHRAEYATEKACIRQALAHAKPIFGICLGAQLLVDVYRGPNGERGRVHRGLVRDGEYGWKRVILRDAGKRDRVLRFLTPQCEMLQWHQDWCQPSPDAVDLAYSPDSGGCSEAFRIGKNAYGIQFHPELTRRMLEEWLSSPKLKGAKQRVDKRFDRYSKIARSMLEAWVRMALA
jgi:GMP synthase-like glutamine amidotransferase